jgi:hypothetical protein
MDLNATHSSDDSEVHGGDSCCLMHPSTMLELRVPTLGVVSLQNTTLFKGAKNFLRCLPSERIPQDSISLAASWLLGRDSDQVPIRVHVEGIHDGGAPCKFLKKDPVPRIC